ncbi:MAG: hypothetical protein FWC65_03665 [Treponema sp.]|nr:hypothetical protein [Treponema sp.]
MRKITVCFGIIFLAAYFAAPSSLFASGRGEAPLAADPVNPEFTLIITAFDVSGLPLARQLMGETAMRNIASSLETIKFRLRAEGETEFHRSYAQENSRAAAARALQARRSERDLLLFRGDPGWRYRRSLRAIDESIADLEARLAEADALVPLVEGRPRFRLSDRNREGFFPPPPDPGEELQFCIAQRADAFLTGSLLEFHGRIYLETRVFTRHTGSFSYGYSILFSSADIVAAMDEISNNLIAAVSGTLPSGVIVRASPPDAIVLVDGVFVGRGDMAMRSHFPGEVEVEIRAHNYGAAVFPMTLNPGELAEVFVDLTPLSLSVFEVAVPGSPGSLVYYGGLFIGETPLAVQLPMGQFSYISVETPDGEVGAMIYRGNELIGGGARLASGGADPGIDRTAIVYTMPPIHPEEGRVERARRGFYRAYGVLWIVLPAAVITAGVAQTYIVANNNAAFNPSLDPAQRQRIHDSATRAGHVRTAAFGTIGVSLGLTFFQIFRYLRAASTDATPIVRAAVIEDPQAYYAEEEYP